ncbi:MAG: energy transducer TonB [Acidobacteriota bacterium]|nr:energy transducer TonB [Acidobacteriota bacterium]
MPLSEPIAGHRVLRAELDQAPNPDLERDLESWTEICSHDDLTGEIASCYLQSPMYSEASSTASGFFTALLHVECDGEVWVGATRGQTNSKGVPVVGSAEDMRPTRAVVGGVVQDAADPARNTLFVSDSATWAGTTLAFEARHPDNSTAVWRLPFGESEQHVVESFLNGPACPRVEPEPTLPEPTPSSEPVIVDPVRISGTDPPFPKSARRAGVRGSLSLRLTISETGDVVNVEVTREVYFGRSGRERDLEKKRRQAAQEQTTKAAVATIRQWKYRPATADGQPVSVYFDVTLTYGL